MLVHEWRLLADRSLVDLSISRIRILAAVGALVVLAAVVALVIVTRDDTTDIAATGDATSTTTAADEGVETTTSTPSSTSLVTAPETTLVDDRPDDADCRPPGERPSEGACFDASGLDADLVAELLNGVRLVRYAEPTDLDCAAGTLVAETDDATLTVYDLPFAGGIRAMPSTYGPTALIGSCEEWINWVAFYDEPSGPSAAPAITAYELPDDVFFMQNFAWVGLTGYLGATASFSDGASPATTASVVIDASDGSIQPADDVFGTRSPRSPDGFDLLVPDGWQLVESAEPALEIVLPESGSRLRVDAEPLPAGPSATAREDETVDSVDDIDITVWEEIDGVHPSSWASGTETRFVSTTSTRWVREIELEDRLVTIEAEVPAGASRGEILFVLYLLDQVRIFSTVD